VRTDGTLAEINGRVILFFGESSAHHLNVCRALASRKPTVRTRVQPDKNPYFSARLVFID
jgi:hypothetical protein